MKPGFPYVIEAHFCVPKETGSVFLLSNYIGARGVAIIVLLVFSVVVVVGEQFLIKKGPSVVRISFEIHGRTIPAGRNRNHG